MFTDNEDIKNHLNTLHLEVKVGDYLKILQSNVHYIKIINTVFIKEHSELLRKQLALLDRDSSEYLNCIRGLDAISYFENFTDTLLSKAELAKIGIQESQEIIDND